MKTIHELVEANNIDAVEALIHFNPDLVKEKNSGGQTPLHIAVWHEHLEIVKLLLKNGAEINAKDHNGYTPLRHCGFKEIVQL